MLNWYQNISGNFYLPIRCKRDNEYLPKLKKVFSEYKKNLNGIEAPKNVINKVDIITSEIINALKLYFQADVFGAQNKILQLLISYKDNEFVYSSIADSCAFRALTPFKTSENTEVQRWIDSNLKAELNFYKARISDDPSKRFTPEEMLHIPFTDRDIIKTQRFSIPGIPCMYFATSSYGCWIEMGKPQDNFFNVCSYKIPNDLKVINLVWPWSLICGLTSGIEYGYKYKIDMDKLIINLIELWPLVCATSFCVDEPKRQFKSEYIISQLIMLCLRKIQASGITYLSKKCSNDTTAFPTCVNLAIPATKIATKISPICETIAISPSVNFGEWNKINPENKSVYQKSFINTFLNSDFELGFASNRIDYNTSVFGQFDNYLTSLNHKTLIIDDINKETEKQILKNTHC
jgi:hypothetical protein